MSAPAAPSAPTGTTTTRKTTPPPPPKQNSIAVYVTGGVFAIILALLFAIPHAQALQIASLAPYGRAFRYVAFPLLAFVLSGVANITVQKATCGTIDASAAFLGAGYFVGCLYAGLLLGTFALLRAPIVSLFVTDNRYSDIVSYENKMPIVLGLAKGYWVLFGALIGQIFGGAVSTVC